MPVTAQELKDRAEARVDDSFPTPAIFLDYANEALRDLAEVLRLETKVDAQLTATDTSILLPTDVLGILLVKLTNGGKLHEISLDDDDLIGYTLFDGTVNFVNCLETADTATVWYYRYPKKIDLITDIVDIPDEYDNAILYYAISRFQQDDENLNLETDYGNMYARLYAQINSKTAKRVGMHKPRRIRRCVPSTDDCWR